MRPEYLLRTIARNAVLAAAFTTFAGKAQILIDFETFPNGSAVAGGTPITTQYASRGVVFGSIPISGASQITTIVDYVSTVSGHNMLGPNGPAPNIGGTLVLTFSTPVSNVGSFFIDDQFPVMVRAFDANNNVVGTTSSDGSNNGFDSWQLNYSPGIARVELAGGFFGGALPDGWGIDNLSFTPVPEPGALSLLLPGFAALLSWSRRCGRPTLL